MVDRFDFGENWRQYIEEYLNDERIRIAKESLTDFYGLSSFDGMTFIDVGCGSGLFSFCAYELGAEHVFSFDYDEEAVECCKILRERVSEPEKWEITQGDILDDDFVSSLNTYDLVYSWGVLHHTGSMYDALDNTIGLVKPGGLLYVALYNKSTEGLLTSEDWLKIKKLYHSSPWPIKRIIESAYIAGWALICLTRLENPIKKARNRKHQRGMAFYPDVKDWLGGYPYEFATVEEIKQYVEDNHEELELQKYVRIDKNKEEKLGNNEYLFKRRNA